MIKIFSDHDYSRLEREVNRFMRDKEIVSVNTVVDVDCNILITVCYRYSVELNEGNEIL